MRLDEQPVVFGFAGPPMHPHQVPQAVQLLAVERERQVALLQPPVRIVLRRPAAAVPNHHGAAAVFAVRNGAFEFIVVDRMVLDLYGEALFVRHQAGAARYRPALHHAVEFEPQIVMQPPGGMLLDDEGVAALGGDLAFRLGGDVEPALAVIGLQPRHNCQPAFFTFRRAVGRLRWALALGLAAGALRSALALRRSASIRLITLPCLGSAMIGGFLPACLALIISTRASS